MFDLYRGGSPTRIGPPIYSATVDPKDDEDLPFITTAIWVGEGGDLAVWLRNCKADDKKAATAVLRNVPSGTWLPIRLRRILKEGTSAGAIIAFT